MKENSTPESQKFPIFISNKPTGEDSFEGGAQQKTAEKIVSLIQENYYSPKVIGVEGEWGAGKSNLVEIIKSKLDNNYVTFIFDVWGNQEDLTRKSFLEQIVNQLIDEKCFTDKSYFERIKEELLAKKSKRKNEKIPIVRPFWLVMASCLLVFGFLNSMYDNILKDSDLIKSINFGIFKPILSIYLIPFFLFLWAINLIIVEYKNHKKNNPDKKFWDILSYITYWFQGKEIVTTENEITLEEEPSVYRFRDYFKKIEQEAKKNGKKIIVVFDNLDRLEKEKIKALWSSIHTFFSESKDELDSWVLIPYNKEELLSHLNNDGNSETGIGFIEKSIPINFRITPPVVREWEDFFNIKLNQAFGNIIIPETEKNNLLKIFDNYYVKTIKPRQIINYINSIVSYYLQREEDILNGEIKVSHLGVFVFAKDEILNDPVKQILSKDYLSTINAEELFEFDESIDKSMSALAFGVPVEMADEVLIYRGIKNIIIEKEHDILFYSNHKAFKSYFYKSYYDVDIKEKKRSIPNILEKLGDFFSNDESQEYWRNYSKELLNSEDDFFEFKKHHKQILLHNELLIQKKALVKKIIQSCASKITSIDGKAQKHYYETLSVLKQFIEENDLDIDIENMVSIIEFSPNVFLECVYDIDEDYKNFKIYCDEKDIVKYFEKSNEELDLNKIEEDLELLEIIKRKDGFKFEKIISSSKAEVSSITWNLKTELKRDIKILKKLSDKPLKLKLSSNFYSQINESRLSEDDIYIDAFCIATSNFTESNPYIGNVTISEGNIKKISERIEWYITYGDLLKLITENTTAKGFQSLKDIANDLTINKYCVSRLDLEWCLKNYSKIVSDVFNSDNSMEEDFINRLEGWSEKTLPKINEIDKKVFIHFNKQNLKLIKNITEKAIEYFNNLSKDEYFEMLKDENCINFVIFNSLINNNLLSKFSDEFYSAYDDFLKGVASEEIKIPNDIGLWDDLIDLLDGRKLKSYFNSLRDYFTEHDDMNDNELLFFEKGLVRFGNLEKKKDDISLKFILPAIKSNDCFESVFLDNWESLKKIVIDSQHKETIISELRIMYNSDIYKNNETMKKISTELNLK